MFPVLWLPVVHLWLLEVHLWDRRGKGWRGLSWNSSGPALSHHQPLFPAPLLVLCRFRLSSPRVGKDLGFTFSPLGISVMLFCRGSQAATAS